MKIEINMPTEFVETLYDILIEATDARISKRTEAGNNIDTLPPSNAKLQVADIQKLTEEITFLDIMTGNITDELKKEGAI